MRKVLFSGVFDLFHLGHLEAIKKAKSFGDYLIVNVASDEEVRRVKGNSRPIIPGTERAELLRGCKYIDEVHYVDYFMTDEELIDKLKADIIVQNQGTDKKFKIEVKYIERSVPSSGLDTTKIIERIS